MKKVIKKLSRDFRGARLDGLFGNGAPSSYSRWNKFLQSLQFYISSLIRVQHGKGCSSELTSFNLVIDKAGLRHTVYPISAATSLHRLSWLEACAIYATSSATYNHAYIHAHIRGFSLYC